MVVSTPFWLYILFIILLFLMCFSSTLTILNGPQCVVLCTDGTKMPLYNVSHHHFALLDQSFGVQWRQFGSMRSALLPISRSCFSTSSRLMVRMYWPL